MLTLEEFYLKKMKITCPQYSSNTIMEWWHTVAPKSIWEVSYENWVLNGCPEIVVKPKQVKPARRVLNADI